MSFTQGATMPLISQELQMRLLGILPLILSIGFLAAFGCSGNTEVERLKAEADVAKAELAKLRNESAPRVAPVSTPQPTAISTDPDRAATEWAISIGATVRVVHSVNKEEELSKISDLDRFKTIPFKVIGLTALRNKLVDDVALEHLQDCSALRRLNLYETSVTGIGFGKLKKCQALEFLELVGCPVTDEGVSHLKAFPRLRDVVLGRTNITDASTEALGNLFLTHYLAIDETRISDDGIQRILNLRNLERLDVRGTRISDASGASFARFKNLSVLLLDRCDISDQTAKQAATLSELGGIYLSGTKVTNAGISSFGVSPKLRELHVNGTVVNGMAFKDFPVSNSIEILHAAHCPISDSDLVHICRLSKLVNLRLASKQITDDSGTSLVKLKNLRVLSLENTAISGKLFAALKDSKIESLGLYDTQIGDEDADELAQLDSLHSIYLDRAPITDAGIKKLVALPHLKEIGVAGTKVTDEGVNFLKQAKPDLRIFR